MSWIPFEDSARSRLGRVRRLGAGRTGRPSHGFKSAVEDVYRPRAVLSRLSRRAGEDPGASSRGSSTPSRIYGRKIVSQPFSEYGGLLLAPDLEAAERDAILDEFRALALETLEDEAVRPSRNALPDEPAAGRFPLPRPCRSSRPRSSGSRTAKRCGNRSPARTGTCIRRARNNGLAFAERTDEEAIRASFYPLYERTMKRLGSPPHPLGLVPPPRSLASADR